MNRWARHLAAALVICCGCLNAMAAGEIKMKYGFATYGYSSSQRFSKPSGVFYDANRGELYVADTGNGQLVILDKKGMPIAKIPHTVVDARSGDRRRGEPRSVVVRKNGDILVADNLCDYLDVLDFRGSSVQKIWPGDLIDQPRSRVQVTCLAIDVAGSVYLGVGGATNEILVLTPGLKLKARIGGEIGSESKSVTGLWVDSGGKIYVSYAMGVCVRVFAPDGNELLNFGAHAEGPGSFSLPMGTLTDEKGRLWVVDMLRHVVSVFKLEPKDQGLKQSFLTLALGGLDKPAEDGSIQMRAGDLAFPSGIAGDGLTRIYTVESTGARVQGFELVSD